ncbi:acyl-CoA dehydrogenase family protein [Nocardiopsis quinghaiensis]|uniref:hypothetical protein n=1 Tax=Nocardiopsis quinghaiensis TaxID=464995 RepID=UPI001CC25B8E|nr:hypothetical protein [Nocardiopsis quinghaiensis]
MGGTAESAEALLGVLATEAEAAKLFTSVRRSDHTPPEPDDVVSRVVEAGYAGDVSHHEEMLRSAVGRNAPDVDSEGNGRIFFLPLVPRTGRDVTAALTLLDDVRVRTGLRPGATVNALDHDVVDLVVSLRFDRSDPGEAARAHRALDLLHEEFTSAGYLPYRLDVDHAFRTARSIVHRLFDLAGGASVYRNRSPMDRWLRDANTMCQHAVAQDSVLQLTGNVLLGGDSTPPFF